MRSTRSWADSRSTRIAANTSTMSAITWSSDDREHEQAS